MDDRKTNNTVYFVRQLMNHRKRIYAFILTLVGNNSDADDIMQDNAALMWQKYHQSEEIRDFTALGLQILHFIQISRSDRFLTLIVTGGGDPENRIVDGKTVSVIDSDWGMFAEPVLVAE